MHPSSIDHTQAPDSRFQLFQGLAQKFIEGSSLKDPIRALMIKINDLTNGPLIGRVHIDAEHISTLIRVYRYPLGPPPTLSYMIIGPIGYLVPVRIRKLVLLQQSRNFSPKPANMLDGQKSVARDNLGMAVGVSSF